MKPGKHWPCNSAVAAELFDLLSGGKVPAGLRTAVGSYMVRHKFFKEPEFAIAEARIRERDDMKDRLAKHIKSSPGAASINKDGGVPGPGRPPIGCRTE